MTVDREANRPAALVVGVSEFGDNLDELPVVAQATNDLAKMMRACQLDVQAVCLNPTADQLKAVLNQATAGELAVVHVVSHGVWDKGSNRLRVAGHRADKSGDPRRWVDVTSWLADVVTEDGPGLLVLLDVCSAGTVAGYSWLDNDRRIVWVLGAAEQGQNAYRARFTRAAVAVLGRVTMGDSLGTHASLPYISLDLLSAAIWREILDLCRTEGGLPQNLAPSSHRLGRNLTPPLFHNPQYDDNSLLRARRELDRALIASLDALDPVLGGRHYRSRGAGTTPDLRVLRCAFTGRDIELEALSGWTERPATSEVGGLRVVTGSPGTGKSALLGVVVCLSHPQLRPQSQAIEQAIPARLQPVPQLLGAIAAVHARNRSTSELLASITRQLGLRGDAESDRERPIHRVADVQALIARLTRRNDQPVIVLDALDEAIDPVGVLLTLLTPLATARLPNDLPVCRLLVGTRNQPRFAALLQLATITPDGLIDLDAVPTDLLRNQVAEYAIELLRTTAEHASWTDHTNANPTVVTRIKRLAHTIADTVTPPARGPVEVGPFLLTQLYVHYLTRDPAPVTVADAEHMGRRAPCKVTEALWWELTQPGRSPWLRPLLVAVAHAQGAGMPLQHARAIARQCVPNLPDTGLDQVEKLLDEVRFYLRTEIDADGSTLYGLFHQTLQDYLTGHPVDDDTPKQPTPRHPAANQVFDALLNEFGTRPEGLLYWAELAVPYLRRHIGAHAIDAGRYDELATDPGYLTHADPDTLLRDLRYAFSKPARLAAAVYRTSAEYHRTATPLQRRRRLGLDAASLHTTTLQQQLTSTADELGIALWTTAHKNADIIDVLTGHTADALAVACAELDGRPVAVTGSRDQTARVWDLATGTPVGSPMKGRTGPVLAVACTELWGRPVAVTGSGTVQVWDLATGTPEGPPMKRHTGPVLAVAFSELKGRPVAVTGSRDQTARVWDLTTGNPVGPPMKRHTGPVLAVACAVLHGRPVAVTGSKDQTAQVWDLATGKPVGLPMKRHNGPVLAVACTEMDGRLVAVTGSKDQTAQVWDLATGKPVGLPIKRHNGPVLAVACTEMDGRPVVVTGSDDGSARVWDLTAGTPVSSKTPHTDGIGAVACTQLKARPVVVTGSRDQTVRVWDVTTGNPVGLPMKRHSGPVLAVACTELKARPVAVTGSRDQTARVWDLATGKPVGPPMTRHNGPVLAVACTELRGRPVAVTGSGNGTVQVWDLTTGKAVGLPMKDHGGAVLAVACTELKGRPVAVTGSKDQTARAWDLAAGKPVGPPMTRHNGPVLAVACSELEGRPVVVTGSRDQTARVWDVASGTPVGPPMKCHAGPVLAVACTEMDGRPVVVTGSGDGTVRVWDLITQSVVDFLELSDEVGAVACVRDVLVVSSGSAAAFRYPGMRPSR